MSARVLLVLALPLLSACTAPIVRDTSLIDEKTRQCETPDCVIKLMDTLPRDHNATRYPFVEGLPDTDLAQLKANGGLNVEIMNPALLALAMYGWAYIDWYPLGGIKSCDVRYVPGFNWFSLKHELSHCQGYADIGIPLQIPTYTDEQQAIMDREGVTKWVDTTVYRQRQALAGRW